jgi:uncharacterized protein YukE
MDRVHQVNEMTSSEVLAAGDSVGQIVSHARNYVAYMQEAMGRITGETGNSEGLHIIEKQGELLAGYLADLERSTARQDAVARQALEQLAAARRAGANMLTVSSQARMLAVNASIEASRLSDESGGAFGVIANEMSAFAKNMQAQSDEIINIVDGLTKSLPKVAELAAALSSEAQQFSSHFAAQNSEVTEVVTHLQQTIREGLKEGDNRVLKILSCSQDALSHLQFQDPCAQRLMQIEADIQRVEQTALDLLRTQDPSVVLPLAAADSHRAAAAGHVMIFDDGSGRGAEDEALAAGEVLLF